MKKFSNYIADQIIAYLDEYHIASDYNQICKTIERLLPKFVLEFDKKANIDEVKKIEKNWSNLPDDKKIEILGELGDLDNFFANLVYQKSIKFPGLKEKYKELFSNNFKKYDSSEKEKKLNNENNEKNDLINEEDKKNDLKKEDNMESIVNNIIDSSEGKNEDKDLGKKKDENGKMKVFVPKEDEFSQEFMGRKSILNHEVDEFSIGKDYASEDKEADSDPTTPDDYVTDETTYDNMFDKKPKSMRRKKV